MKKKTISKKIISEQPGKYLERASYAWSEDSIRLIMTPSAFAKATYFYVQETGYFKTGYPYFTERKNLPSYLILYTISGKGILHFKSKKYNMTKDSCFYIDCMEHHQYETLEGEQWEFLWLHFNGSNALGYYKEFTKAGFKILQLQNSFFMESTLMRILALNQKKDVTTELQTSSIIVNLLTQLLLLTCMCNAETIFVPTYIREITKEIERNFKTDLNLTQFEASCNRSKFHIAREFKKYIGITVNEYIITTRISYAKELLKYSELSVGEIAYESGIQHISHFIELFKAREKMTPLTYRKQWRN